MSSSLDAVGSAPDSRLPTPTRETRAVLGLFNAQETKGWQRGAKKIFDVIGASIALVVFALPMLVIAVAIVLDSSGPALFTQDRAGRNGRGFRIYKFRTMKAMADSRTTDRSTNGHPNKSRTDPRFTRLGAFLRRTSLDELPQFINVLRGEMSLVGPRPFVPEETGTYTARQLGRLLAAPGMTGIWQVSGRSLLPFTSMMELDLEYVSKWSFWMDLRILARTIPAVVSGKGAF